MTHKLLLIAQNWPEPASTAAGRRSIDLLFLFKEMGYELHVASAAEQSPFQENLDDYGVNSHSIAVNDSHFDHWLAALCPSIVIYDRYVMEEQFGWRVHQVLPSALTLLDTSDLHFLRQARQTAFKKDEPMDLYNPTTIRELTCINRCDLCLVISNVEQQLLEETFRLPRHKVLYLPFLVEETDIRHGLTFGARKHCVMLGGFKHEPNRDATRWLRESLWPAIKKGLPADAEMHVYGAYADHAMNQLNAPSERFFIKGRTQNSITTLEQYRVNVAPLRFGAGQKGKILEGWLTGTPTITTHLGAESMVPKPKQAQVCADSNEDFANLVAACYSDEGQWLQTQALGHDFLRNDFLKSDHKARFFDAIEQSKTHLESQRHADIYGRILWQNQFKASEYMSRWIEAKNQ